jgi:2-(1,2-epoxy-1,2-dihydrophenyl)acetyl-CoA isomerase
MAAFSTIKTAAEQGVLTITLNRPDALNAMTESACAEFGAALRMAQRDDAVRCLVLTGAGRGFCAGQDLKELQALRQEALRQGGDGVDFAAILRQRYNPLILRLRAMEKPVLAAVNGPAVGAGVSFALAADLRLAARSASFRMAFVNIGLVPDCAATLTLVQHVGYARAAELCLLGEDLAAEEAQRWGLVNRVVPDEELVQATRELAQKLAAQPARAVALAKRALNRAWTATLDGQLEYEALLQGTAGATPDHAQRLEAFLDRRRPPAGGK